MEDSGLVGRKLGRKLDQFYAIVGSYGSRCGSIISFRNMDSAVQEYEGSEFGGEESLEQETKTKRGRGLPDSCNDPSSPDFLVGKPQVWVRMRPACCDNNIFSISEDNKTMCIVVEPEDRIMQKKSGKTAVFQYCTDGILKDCSQKETYKAIVHELVQHALEGICGAVLCVGPEFAGKSHTMFGSLDRYQERGIVFRAIEELFEEAEAMRNEKEFHIVLSMFEVRKDKIKDLITIGDYDLKQVGEFGPKGLFYEEIFNMEQALMLILRGLAGQKMLPREPWARPHTVIYIDIICRHLQRGIIHTRDWRSRLTFVENAPLPQRQKAKQTYIAVKNNNPVNSQSGVSGWPSYAACPGGDPYLETNEDNTQQQTGSVKQQVDLTVKDEKVTCGCGKGGSQGPLTEAISIRKDFSFLEQMFVRAHDLRKIATYYAKLKSLGMYMLHQPPKLAPSQYFRQSRLAHCLKDVVTGKTEVRVILHIRPEKEFIQSSLEAMRFAERARCIPCEEKSPELKEEKTFEEQIGIICKELGIENTPQPKGFTGVNSIGVAKMFPHIDAEKMKEIMNQATTHFEDKLNTLEGSCKEQVKNMFETFREIWMHMLDTTSQQALPPKPEETPPEPPEPVNPEKQETNSEATTATKDGNKKKAQKEKGKENKKEKGKKRRSSQKLQKSKSKTDRRTDLESAGGASTVGLDDMNLAHDDVTASVPPPTPNTEKEERLSLKNTPNAEPESKLDKKGTENNNKSRRTSSRTSANGKGKERNSQKRSVTEPAVDTNNPDGNRLAESHPVSAPEALNAPKLSLNESEATEVPATTAATVTSAGSPTEETAEETEESRMHTAEVTADIKFKHEAWQGFKAEDVGGKMLAEYSDLQTVFRQILLQHSEIQKSIGDITVKLTSNHVELDILDQERSLAGVGVGVTLSGTALKPSAKEEEIAVENESLEANRNELIAQLNDVRQQLQMNKQMLDEKKRQIEVLFYDYFMDKYNRFPKVTSLPLSTLHQVTTASALGALGFSMPVSEEDINRSAADKELRRSILEQVMSEKFADIKRMAKQQAKEILSFYPKRPAWSNV